MDEKEFLREKEKLKEVCKKLAKEEENFNNSLSTISINYEKESYVKAHLEYLAYKKLLDLKQVKQKPYFARIDFKADNDKEEKLYIGKLSILDSDTQEPIIIDWRAPISNLYYDRSCRKNKL